MDKNEQDQRLSRLRAELTLGLEQAEQGKLVDLNLDEIEESALAKLETGNLSVKESATYSANAGSKKFGESDREKFTKHILIKLLLAVGIS